jgi:hypothetical protein
MLAPPQTDVKLSKVNTTLPTVVVKAHIAGSLFETLKDEMTAILCIACV